MCSPLDLEYIQLSSNELCSNKESRPYIISLNQLLSAPLLGVHQSYHHQFHCNQIRSGGSVVKVKNKGQVGREWRGEQRFPNILFRNFDLKKKISFQIERWG